MSFGQVYARLKTEFGGAIHTVLATFKCAKTTQAWQRAWHIIKIMWKKHVIMSGFMIVIASCYS